MNRRLWLYLAVALLAAAPPASAARVHVGLGAFGGASIPVVQDDTGSGPLFGVRVPVRLLRLLTVEPYFAKSNGGARDQAVIGSTYTRSGIDVTSFGANLLVPFGARFGLAPYVGIGSNRLERPGLDATTAGYTFGLGFAYHLRGLPVAVQARGELNAVHEEGISGTSRKWAGLSVGATYDLFAFPRKPEARP